MGGKVISGARIHIDRLVIDIQQSLAHLPESQGLRLKTLMMGFCSILANLLDSIK